VIVVENLPYPQDRRVRLEAEALRVEGATVTVVAPADIDQTARETINGVFVRRFPRGVEARSLWGYVREYAHAWVHVARLLHVLHREQGFDVLHLCTPPDLFFPLALWYRRHGVRFVFDHHDASPELLRVKVGRGALHELAYWCLRAAEWCSMHFADAVIASSEPLARIARGRGRVPADRVFLVRSGSRQSLDLTPQGVPVSQKHVIGFVGCMGRQDGLEYLVEAARYLWVERGRRDIEWLLIGDGPERENVAGELAKLGMEGSVRFAGFVSDEQRLRALLVDTTVCVTPDPVTPFNVTCAMAKVGDYVAARRAQVGFQLPETEALAGASALLVSSNSGVALAEGILAVLDQPDRRHAMEKAAALRAPALHWDASIPALVAAYQRALGTTQ
jgi:glycosyltransferase involved in cell wall biosynthesis